MTVLPIAAVLLTSLPTSTNENDAFRATFDRVPNRVWVGPDYWANRLQDWRVEDERVLCVEDAARYPLRTLQILPTSIADSNDAFDISVELEQSDSSNQAGSFAGLLLGQGGPTIDHRVSAMTHHRPAEDGGLIIAADHAGRIHFYDNEQGGASGNQWSLGGALKPGDLIEISPRSLMQAESAGPIRLTIAAEPDDVGCRLVARTHAIDSNTVLDERVFEQFDPTRLTGSVALVSHLGKHWFDNLEIEGPRQQTHTDRSWGPVLMTMYTVDEFTLKLTAQMGPLGSHDAQQAHLAIHDPDGSWRRLGSAELQPDSYTFQFNVGLWNPSQNARLRIEYELADESGSRMTMYTVDVAAEPTNGEMVIASLNCQKTFTGNLKWNHDSIWFPHAELVSAVSAHDPDLLFFAGDQIYEGDLVGVDNRSPDVAMLDYLYKWYRFCWSFEGLTRSRPTVAIPDDHDVYHGNLWGAGGRRAKAGNGLSAQDSGGYKMPARFVNAVHRTQTSHLPDPPHPGPIGQGISVYYTDLTWGGVSFVILADRMFKDSAAVIVPEGKNVNGWFQNPDFNPRDADVPGAVLLGDQQEQFLRSWASDWSDDVWMKGVLSQTIFANVATLPDTAKSDGAVPGLAIKPESVYATGDSPAADTDSNGWPQAGRNRALRAMRTGYAFHLAGDQHLGSLIHYGVDDWRDAGVAFCSPAIANTWPRRWFPPSEAREGITDPSDPAYTGDYFDGFGNRVTVYAVANPRETGLEPARLYDRAPGYGIIRLNRDDRSITMECWPRWAQPNDPNAEQFTGWPRTFTQGEMFRPGDLTLPTIRTPGLTSTVFQVIDETTGEIISTLRIDGSAQNAAGQSDAPIYTAAVPGSGPYTVRAGDPDLNIWKSIQGLRPVESPTILGLPFDSP